MLDRNAETRGEALALMCRNVETLLEEVGPDVFPFYKEDGSDTWTTTEEWNWASSHWIGLLWILARRSRPGKRRELEETATRLALRVAETDRTDNIFYGLNAQLGGFDGFDQTGDERLRQFGLAGADAMVQLFNPAAQQIPIGRHKTVGIDPRVRQRNATSFDRRFVAAVDVIHTSVPVLWRAWHETGESKYLEVATRHCERHLHWHIREDGSVSQKTAFSPDDGSPLRQFSPLAASDDGCWSRGIAWHISGAFEAWRETSDTRFRSSLERSLSYYSEHTSEDLIPRYDLTAETGPLDTSAAAIVAWGLRNANDENSTLVEVREGIVNSLLSRHLDESGGLTQGCYSVSSNTATDAELIWGDYYLASALEAAGA